MAPPANLAPDLPTSLGRRAAAIRLLALDVDGVLTDGTVYYDGDGESVKAFNIMDGLGIRLLERAGIRTAIISARDSAPLRRRAADLGIDLTWFGEHDKVRAWTTLLDNQGLDAEQAAFMGDDLIDLGVLARAGLALAPANGHPAVRERAHYVATREGGHGAVREVAEMLLAAQGSLDDIIASYAAG